MTTLSFSALAILLPGGTGFLFHSSLPRTGRLRAGMFCFYTNLSNLLVLLYELALFLTALLRAERLYSLLTDATVSLSMAACIWLTHLIYHFILLPNLRGKDAPFADSAENTFGNLCVHYVTPLLVLAQWLLFADKTALRLWSAAAWLVLPLAYLLFAMLRAKTGRPIGNTKLIYPYPFLALPQLGVRRFWRGILRLSLFCLALGLLLVGIGKLTLLLR